VAKHSEVEKVIKINKYLKMELQGKIKLVGETKEFGSNGFKKRELVVTTEEQYPQHILIEFVQDKTDLLNNYQVGQNVKVSINLRGREWVNPEGETKYFNAIQGWRIENLQQEASNPEMPPIAPSEAFEPATDLNEEDHDDLPF
jgi:translation initiation factor IF-3